MIKTKLFSLLAALGIILSSLQLLSEAEHSRQAISKNTVRILTLNAALLTVLFETIDINLRNNSNRAELIGKTIRAMSVQPDVVLLQEAFDSKSLRNKLYAEIKDLYPHVLFDTRTNAYLGGGVNSGLAILSKYPITKKLQKDFTCWAGVEALARKGIMATELSVNGCPLYIFTSHFQAGVSKDWYIKLVGKAKDWLAPFKRSDPRNCEGKNPDSLTSSEIVHMELHQAKKVIDSFVDKKDAPIVFAGDFNISRLRDAEDYDEFLKTFPGALDTYLNGSKKIKSTSWEKGEVAQTETDRVDYVWLLNPSDTVEAKSDIIDDFTHKMTDHLGILATVTFNC